MKTAIRNLAPFFFFAALSLAHTRTVPPEQVAPQTAATPGPATTQAQAAELVKQGRKLHAEGKLDEALDLYKKAMALAPDLYDVHVAIGSLLDVKGDYADARHHLQRAIEVADAEHKPGVLRTMAVSYAFERKAKEAASYERQAYQLQMSANKPVDAAGTLNEWARIELESGAIDEAYNTYGEGFVLASKSVTKPADVDLWNFRWEHAQGRIAVRRGQKEEAQKHMAAAKAILDKGTNPNQAIFFPYLTGYVAFYRGDYKSALAELQKAEQKDPFILALIAQTYEKLNDKVQAKEYWTKVLGIYSHNPTNAFARPLAKKALGMN